MKEMKYKIICLFFFTPRAISYSCLPNLCKMCWKSFFSEIPKVEATF
jgi:hypothetical protein